MIFLTLVFFPDHLLPSPLTTLLASFRLLSKICEDIRNSRSTTDVNDIRRVAKTWNVQLEHSMYCWVIFRLEINFKKENKKPTNAKISY